MNARIRFDGRYYDTPSGDGKAARNKSTNGWAFWKYKDRTGNLVKLAKLRKQKFLIVQDDLGKTIDVVWRKLCFLCV